MARVLVIDSRPAFRLLAHRILRDAGHDTIEARDALAGLQRAVEDVPDWVLVEASLPGLDGVEVGRLLRASESTRRLTVIVWEEAMATGEGLAAVAARVGRVGPGAGGAWPDPGHSRPPVSARAR
ncbi:MAG: response regulator [Spirochaetaceae bacterium]|nr:response regulator [Myxococcales bacterium]MCB9723652.1 response regulator [Spirochaetaceae bacterium]